MQIKKIFYKTDFQITEHTEVGYSVPFRFAYFAANENRTYVASFDGTTYTNCHLTPNGDLCVAFDDHHLGCGQLMVQRTYYLNNECYVTGVCDERIQPEPVVIRETPQGGEPQSFHVVLDVQGATTIEAYSEIQPYYAKGDRGYSAYEVAVQQGFVGTVDEWLASLQGEQGDSAYDVAVQQGFVGTKDEWLASLKGQKGDQGISGGMLFPTMQFDAEDGSLTIRGLKQEVDRIRFNYATAELFIRL